MKQYEAVVIGAGPGGYEAAVELGKAGIKTLLIEKRKEHIGGVCLNEGCIPTKNYLQSAQYVSKIPYFMNCGLALEWKGLNLMQLADTTRGLKNELRSGIVWLLDQAGVETMFGTATFIDAYTVDVAGEKIGFEKCLIATGAHVRETSILPLDGKKILSSNDIFELNTLPKSMIIVGGGAIGCEFATFFNAFGVEVTLIARGDQLLSGEDEDVAKTLLRAFKKSTIDVRLSTSIVNANVNEREVELQIMGEREESLRCELVLCAIGRDPYTEGLFPENAGVKQNEKGFIEINEAFQTTQEHIYAVGDCIDTPAFAHTAYVEARIAAHNMISGEANTNTHVNPSTIFSDPQIASCGLNEKEAREQGIAIEIKKAFFKVNAKAKILGDDAGFAKIIVCAQSGVILGAAIIGVEATEIIHEMVIAIEKKLTAKELIAMIHVHPSVSEIIRYL